MKNFNDILFKNISLSLDGDADYQEWLKINHKYSDDEKSDLLSKIIDENHQNNNFINRLQKCLPNGLNQYYSYEDLEYEALKKEFE